MSYCVPAQDGELPDDVDWHFVFKVKDGEVHRVCPPTSAALRAKRFHCNPHNSQR